MRLRPWCPHIFTALGVQFLCDRPYNIVGLDVAPEPTKITDYSYICRSRGQNTASGSWKPAAVFYTNNERFPHFLAYSCLICALFFCETFLARSRKLTLRSTRECTSAKHHCQTTTTTPSVRGSSQLALQICGDLSS